MAERCIVKSLGKSCTSFAGVHYNEMKVAQGMAKCVLMRNFGNLQKYNIHAPVVVSNYLQKIADHNSRVSHKQKHMTFSFPGKATPEQTEQLLKDAAETMDRLGYKDQPQIYWVHNDTDNTHIHVVSVTVSVKDGMWIDNWQEGRRARRILDQLRGHSYKSEIDKLFDYKFESREQFKSLLLANGYRCNLDEENGTYDILRNHELVGSILTDELDKKIAANGRNKDNYKNIVVDLRGKLMDNRRRSMKQKLGEPVVLDTKKGKQHTLTNKLAEVKNNRFNGDKGLDIKGEEKAQFKQFLIDLKQKLGISLVFSQWKDGQTKGYTIIDNKNKMVFKGSDVVDLQKLLNPEWKKGMEKDAVISANEASSMADEISMDKNLPQFLQQQFDKLGIEVVYNKEEAMNRYGGKSEQENRDMAVNLFNQVLDMVANQEDLTVEGERDIRSMAIEAMNRAVCADSLHQQEEEQKARQKAEEEARRSEQEKAKARAEAAKTMTADRVASFVTDAIDDYNIFHDPGGHKFNLTGMKEDVCIRAAMTFLEKAITEPYERMKNANLAIGYARAAEQLHQQKIEERKVVKPVTKPTAQKYVLPDKVTVDNVMQMVSQAARELGLERMVQKIAGIERFDLGKTEPQKYADYSLVEMRKAYNATGEQRIEHAKNALYFANMAIEQQRRRSTSQVTSKPISKPAGETKPVAPKVRPVAFTGFNASVVAKDGKYYITATVGDKSLEKQLASGHLAWYRQEPNKVEAARGLALHYFSQEFYLAKRDEYKKQCISHGYLPYGMELSKVKTLFNKMYGRIDYPNKDWDANCSHEYSEKDRLPGESDKQMFIRQFGSEEADNFWGHTFKDIKDFIIDKPAEFEDSKAIGETLGVFNEIAAAFNDSVAAIIGFALGSDVAYVPSCGGGGGNNNLPKKKDDDDRKHPRSLFSRPIKGKGLRK